ncbi:MAG: hypothetical protein ACREMA_05825, partial [Longimicrobiales bacterium]
MRGRGRRHWLFLFILVELLIHRPLAGQQDGATTPTVFRRYADRVVKIQVVESGSQAKAGLGSGFYVS